MCVVVCFRVVGIDAITVIKNRLWYCRIFRVVVFRCEMPSIEGNNLFLLVCTYILTNTQYRSTYIC